MGDQKHSDDIRISRKHRPKKKRENKKRIGKNKYELYCLEDDEERRQESQKGRGCRIQGWRGFPISRDKHVIWTLSGVCHVPPVVPTRLLTTVKYRCHLCHVLPNIPNTNFEQLTTHGNYPNEAFQINLVQLLVLQTFTLLLFSFYLEIFIVSNKITLLDFILFVLITFLIVWWEKSYWF